MSMSRISSELNLKQFDAVNKKTSSVLDKTAEDVKNMDKTSLLNINEDKGVQKTLFDSSKETNKAIEGAFKKNQTAKEQLEETSKKAKELIDSLDLKTLGLSFSIDEITDKTLVNVLDTKTDEIVRQIPSEEFIKVAQNISKMQEEQKEQSITNTKEQQGIQKGLILDQLV